MNNAVSDEADSKLAKAFLQFYHLFRLSGANDMDRSGSAACNKKYKLKFSEFLLLFYVKFLKAVSPDGVTASEISAAMRVKPPTINPLLTNLANLGLITRKTDENDRRFIRIALTKDGINLIEVHEKAFQRKFHGVACYLGEEKSNQLAELIDEVYVYFSNQRNQSTS